MSADPVFFKRKTTLSRSARRQMGISKSDIEQIELFIRESGYLAPCDKYLSARHIQRLLNLLVSFGKAVPTPVRWIVFWAPEVPYRYAGVTPPASREVLQEVLWHLFVNPRRSHAALEPIAHSVKHGVLLTEDQIQQVQDIIGRDLLKERAAT